MNEKKIEQKKIIFKNSKSPEVVMGIRSKQTKDLVIVDCFYFNDIKDMVGENIRENHMISSLAFTRETAKDLISHLQKFIDEK